MWCAGWVITKILYNIIVVWHQKIYLQNTTFCRSLGIGVFLWPWWLYCMFSGRKRHYHVTTLRRSFCIWTNCFGPQTPLIEHSAQNVIVVFKLSKVENMFCFKLSLWLFWLLNPVVEEWIAWWSWNDNTQVVLFYQWLFLLLPLATVTVPID